MKRRFVRRGRGRRVSKRGRRVVKRGRRLQTKGVGAYGNVRRRRFAGGLAASFGAAQLALQGVRSSYNRLKRKRTTSAPVTAMQELSKSRKSLRMGSYKMSRVVNSLVNKRVERFQLLSNFDTNVGAHWIDNASLGTGEVLMPMSIIDCGSIHQTVVSISPPAVFTVPYWENATAAAGVRNFTLQSQMPDGTTAPDNGWQIEYADEFKNIHPTVDSMILNWVDLRLNLYGQRKRTTKFQITVFQCTDEEVDPITGEVNNVDRRALYQYLTRPFIYSNLQQDFKLKKTGIKIIKDFVYNVAPMTSIDLNTSTGNIHEANIHVKINKTMNYMYNKEAQMLPHAQADGLDYSSFDHGTAVHSHPRPKQNVYIAIRAFAPIRVTAETRTANDCPSFDVICRRSISLPS